MKPLPKQYNHKETEKRWQDYWLEHGTYDWDASESRENTFVVDTPPPTVSGLLHMGHIYSYTQADFVSRFMRMRGKTVFYPMGFDDNGLPTERLVEKTKKIRAADLPREEFIATCKDVVKDAEDAFRNLFKSVALSVDWNQEYQTISEESRTLSQMSFLDLFHKEKCYRKLQPMLWDPVDQTAIAQAEVEDKEQQSFANYIRFGLMDKEELAKPPLERPSWESLEKVEIMTTRPELLIACVALMCHPDDAPRYEGKVAVTPVFNVIIDIVADAKVDKDKGTGLVMCCTFGDETDKYWWETHNLPLRIAMNIYAKIHIALDKETLTLSFEDSQAIIDANTSLDITKAIGNYEHIHNKKIRPNTGNPGGSAREIMVELLKQETSAFIRQEAITHNEPCAERSGAPLELLPTYQWFIRILDQKDELKAKAAECHWCPEFMRIRMDQWIDGLSWDWCISRQRYFGVPFPVWYSIRPGEEGKILVADKNQLPVNPLTDLPKGYNREEVIAEGDVMDTWATSSVSPQLSSKGIAPGYMLDETRHKKLFPADIRPQAHEIIRTWAFYTIVKAHLHENTIPWKHLMISGWCLASDKTKMSKSKGNVVTPVELIQEKGADAVRFWASTSRLGADTAFSEDVLKIGKKLVTKLWNATKFASLHLEKLTYTPTTAQEDSNTGLICEPLDGWVLTRLQRTISKATDAFEKFEYAHAREAIEDFFWNDFCDNYLEFIKVRAYGEAESVSPAQQQSAILTVYHCLDGILRLFAPFVPHITEELYSHIFEDKHQTFGGSIHARGTWPNQSHYPILERQEQSGFLAVSILNAIRKAKAEQNLSIKWPISLCALDVSAHDTSKQQALQSSLEPVFTDLRNVTNAEKITFASASEATITQVSDSTPTITLGLSFLKK